jgi:hypothetical protein
LTDMNIGLPAHGIGLWSETPAPEYARLAQHRRQLLVLIGEFRQAVARPRGRRDAIRVLRGILPCAEAYFGAIESLLDRISAAGAAPHRDGHRHILGELKSTLQRSSSSDSERPNSDLVHALDGLVLHEATIRLRAPENSPLPSSGGAAALSRPVEAALPL